jgi:hypothetical protein
VQKSWCQYTCKGPPMTKKSKVDFLKGDWWKSITRVGRPDVLNVNAHASDTHGHIFLYWSEGFLSRRNKKSRRRLIGFFCSFKERKNKYKSFLSVDISKDKRESSTLFLMLYKSFHAPANKTRSSRLGNRNKKKRAGKMWIYVHTHKMDDALGQQPYVPLTSINQ